MIHFLRLRLWDVWLSVQYQRGTRRRRDIEYCLCTSHCFFRNIKVPFRCVKRASSCQMSNFQIMHYASHRNKPQCYFIYSMAKSVSSFAKKELPCYDLWKFSTSFDLHKNCICANLKNCKISDSPNLFSFVFDSLYGFEREEIKRQTKCAKRMFTVEI